MEINRGEFVEKKKKRELVAMPPPILRHEVSNTLVPSFRLERINSRQNVINLTFNISYFPRLTFDADPAYSSQSCKQYSHNIVY